MLLKKSKLITIKNDEINIVDFSFYFNQVINKSNNTFLSSLV